MAANQAPAPRRIKGYGWRPDLPDIRDHFYSAPLHALGTLPSKVDLRPHCPKEVYDQGQLGSCTANAIAAAVQFDRMKQQLTPDFIPSRLFIYYNERVIEGTVGEDSGAYIRDGIKSVNRQGVCPETEWTYNISRFTEKPSEGCYTDALKTRATSYSRLVRSLTQMKGCLASGFPFVFGFTVYESFESHEVAKTGVVPMPSTGEKVLGGHAVLAVGYDDASSRFLVRNSWGPGWGMDGYFTMPYAYLTDGNLSDDFWTIRMISAPGA
ncbi:C1 family peptidase [Paracraurococcus lichenis]|uniref:C1 family peptidase n=1 Tax=Paracraurococcus lichenis TaxID=3064888 RepID=A0ABT9E5I8_9PROT|nr:C1 family peptidase [Paracraurococcus sp. LOR1-02]MDO9711335.1 C1 family peptidase [Paracraurococcus sp. LOR1-02]